MLLNPCTPWGLPDVYWSRPFLNCSTQCLRGMLNLVLPNNRTTASDVHAHTHVSLPLLFSISEHHSSRFLIFALSFSTPIHNEANLAFFFFKNISRIWLSHFCCNCPGLSCHHCYGNIRGCLQTGLPVSSITLQYSLNTVISTLVIPLLKTL